MPSQPKTSRRELTPAERAYLVGRHDAGESFGKISKTTKIPKSTLIDTIQNAKKGESTESLPRAASRKTDVRDNRRLYRETRKGPKSRRAPLGELQANFQPQLSTRMIQCRLKEQTINKWLTKDRPQLTQVHKKARY
jgi:hypothetical protein